MMFEDIRMQPAGPPHTHLGMARALVAARSQGDKLPVRN